MSSFDKVVKLACKPKAAPPKAKYIDPIIAATWSEDGAVHDVCKALAPRIREPNAIIVFKALIVLHTMIRNGATDNVLSYLSTNDVLRLRNVTANNWEGYAAPQNLQNYALYLDSRIRAYKDLKHDAVKVQAESNRDMRNSASLEEEGYRARKDHTTKPNASAPARSKTIMGRKLRSMTVEKGLLRETKAVHGMIDALVECRFYLDDLEDELTTTALRMLVKDLLILFQAGNEGVINVLEHYFEMSHVDASEALKIYRHFCKQTEYVVEFLGVAKKLQNLLNVSIPNLRHAPVSLAGALQEYLDDPSFDQNRIEYKANKDAAERGKKPDVNGASSSSSSNQPDGKQPSSPAKVSFASNSKDASSPAPRIKQDGRDVQDFFSAIEETQPTMFNPATNSPSTAYFQQQGASNPFAQMAMATGQPFMQQHQLMAQPTGFIMPQATAMQQSNPFGNFLAPQQVPQPTGHRPFSSFLQPQQTGFSQQMQQPQPTGFASQQPQTMNFNQQPQASLLQPQATGGNPFRQSMMIPQSTSLALFGAQGQFNGGQVPPLPSQSGMTAVPPFMTGASSMSPSQGPSSASAFTAPKASHFGSSASINTPARPASTPLTSSAFASGSTTQPVKTHVTGTNNPFGPITIAPPPVPKPPTLFELSIGSINPTTNTYQQQSQQQQQQQQRHTGFNNFSFNNSALNPGGTDISSVASSFTSNKTASASNGPLATENTSATTSNTTGSTFSNSLFSSSLSSQPTGATNTSLFSSSQIPAAAPMKSHLTGFTGLKPFKPSSSFGASLMESLPAITGSAPTTPSVSNNSANTTPGGSTTFSPTSTTSPSGLSFNTQNGVSGNAYSFLNSQPTGAAGNFGGASGGSTLGVGLRPQLTGEGAANPFRASMAAGLAMPGAPNFGASPFPFQSSPAPGLQTNTGQPFGSSTMGNQQRPQQSTFNSLI